MALDSSLFAIQIPAATYAVGDTVTLKCIRGPALVRAGYGAAYLKKIFTEVNLATTGWAINVRNSNWIDGMSNIGTAMSEASLDDNSINIQRGHDCPLTPNSTWEVTATCMIAGTETAAGSIFALIDVDYPSVASIKNPRVEQGVPVSINSSQTVTVTATTTDPASLTWTVFNMDIFKAGFRYLLDQASIYVPGATAIAFIEISGAAGQNGLTRIIPCRAGTVAGIRYLIDYATPLVKGPMNVAIAAIGTAGSVSSYMSLDWVKR